MARFFLRGKTTVYWTTAIANTAIPTAAEINAGINLKADLCNFTGFQLSNAQITTPDMATNFDTKIDGILSTADSSLEFYDSDAGTHPARTAMAPTVSGGVNGFLVFARYPTPATKRCEVWPSRSTFIADTWVIAAQAATFMIGYAITSVPIQSATFPAGVVI